ncbi:kinesin-like protein KIF26B isoform X2 [Octopus bimaculoides]|nr:kinesin-like protein KIF26B isoform X2 [Octopus bimaculoides]|eukprot:XP_014774932.1 PREDICTED: kinesin-like protein KIF26B isoform X2 [Octopus bimaculoides]
MEVRKDKYHEQDNFNGCGYDTENIYQEIAEDRLAPLLSQDVYAMDERIYHEPHHSGVLAHPQQGENLYSVCNVGSANIPTQTHGNNIHCQEYSLSGGYYHSKMVTVTPSEPRSKKHFESAKCPTAAAPDNSTVRCENCTYTLLDFKRQLMQLMGSDARIAKFHGLPARIEESLQVAENLRRVYSQSDRCDICKTHISQLKQEAFLIVRSIQTSGDSVQGAALQIRSTQTLPGSPPSYQRPSRGQNIRHVVTQPTLPMNMQSQEYIEQKSRIWASSQKKFALVNRPLPGGPSADRTPVFNETVPLSGNLINEYRGSSMSHPRISSPPSSPYNQPRCTTVNAATSPMAQPSSASSFFARAAQKLSISSKKKKKSHMDPELPIFPTCYSEIIRLNPPPAPPYLLRNAGKMQNPGIGKVKVMVRIFSPPNGNNGDHSSLILSVDARKKQITLHDPSTSGYVSAAHRRTGIVAPKTFAFDAVFPQDDSLTEICASTLTDIIQGVVSGADGCIFSFGYSRASKSHTMFGKDQSPQTLGLIPCAIAWLFRLIDEHRDATGARFSVRVSAVEVSGKQECLKDLLADVAQVGTETGVSTAPGVYLREDPICGTQLENQSELRAPTADQAAYYLDAAIAARSTSDEEELRHSHLLFTLHVYQYRVEKANKSGLPGVAGGRSRLHFIDLGSCSKSKDPNNVSLSLSALGNVILALLNGQRHIPHRDAKIARLLRDSLGNVSCRTCMIAHVSATTTHYSETLQVIQLASRIHRLRRRKMKFSSTSSEDSSTDESGRLRRPLRGFRMGTLREDFLYSSSLSDPDCTSGSEQSCDTVIYLGINGQSLSDRELTDNEGPPKSLPLLPRTNPRLPRRTSGSRSSGDEGSASDTGRKFSPVDSGRVSVSKLYYNREPSPQSRIPVMSPVATPSSSQDCPSPPLVSSSTGYQVARRTNIKQKMPLSKFKPEGGVNGRHQINNEGSEFLEQWVDGPGAAIYPDKKSTELWVDGPQAFMVRTGNGSSRKQPRAIKETDEAFRGRVWVAKRRNGNSSDGDTQTLRNITMPKEECEPERWIDGPSSGADMSTSDTRVSNINQAKHFGPSSRKKCPSQTNQPSTSNRKSPDRSIAVPPSPMLAAPIDSKVIQQQDVPNQGSRPESTASVDSINAEPSDSRPVSFHSNVQSTEDDISVEAIANSVDNGIEDGLENFVTGWVGRHGTFPDNSLPAPCEENDPNLGFIVDSCNQVIGSLESFSNYSQPQASIKPCPTINNIQPPSTRIDPVTETTDCVSVNAHTTRRVAEWLKTVSTEEEQSKHEIKAGNSSSNLKFGALKHGGVLGSETLASIDAKALGKEIDRVWFTDDEVSGEQKFEGFYNSGDTVNDNNPETEFANLLISNRESIYEIHVDQQLELARKNNPDATDDDTFSTVSFPKEDPESLAIAQEEERVITVQKLKALNAAHSEQSTLMRDVRSHCQYEGSKLSDLEEVSEEESVLECKLLCSRNIDGASEPCLSKEIFHEDGGAFDVSVIKQNYTINPTSSSIYITTSKQPLSENISLLSDNNDNLEVSSLPGYSVISQYDDDKVSKFSGSQVPVYNLNNVTPLSPSMLQRPLNKINSKSKEADVSFSPGKIQSKHSEVTTSFSLTNQGSQECSSPKIQTKFVEGSSYSNQGPALLTSSPTIQNKVPSSAYNSHVGSSLPLSSPTTQAKYCKGSLPSSPSLTSSSGHNNQVPHPTSSSSPTVQAKHCKGSTVSLTSSSHNSRGKERGSKMSRFATQSTTSNPRNRSSGSKSQSPSRSRLPIFNPSNLCQLTKLRKKDKANVEKTTQSKPHDDGQKGWCKSSETGVEKTTPSKVHDEGRRGRVKNAEVAVKVNRIVGGEEALLSPYATVTKPRVVRHSSSGHCSDNSSTVSTEIRAQMGSRSDKLHGGGTSSGYESMLRDSEATGSSSSSSSAHEDSASECSSSDRKKGTRRKKVPGSRRSRSAPARSASGSPLCGLKGDANGQQIPPSPSSKAWVDTRQIQKLKDEPMEIRNYDSEDVERMHRRRKDELEVYEQRRERVLELLNKQEELKQELTSAKDRLMIEQASWNFDCKSLLCFTCRRARKTEL